MKRRKINEKKVLKLIPVQFISNHLRELYNKISIIMSDVVIQTGPGVSVNVYEAGAVQ